MGRTIRGLSTGCLLAMVFGCGASGPSPENVAPVSGLVKLEGKPADNVKIVFVPAAKTTGRGGIAVTNSDGTFEVINSSKQMGLVPGIYEVNFSRKLQPDGTPPVESDPKTMIAAVETLDPRSNVDPKSFPPKIKPIEATIPEAGATTLSFEVYPRK